MDALDLIEHINYNGGKQVDYAYNKTGDLVKMEDWSGTTTYEVDLLHQLTATTDRLGKHVAYTYDGVGNQTSVSYPDGTTATKEYDLVHNLTTVIEEDGRTTSYTYDGMRRVTHMDYPDGWQEDYHYDSIGQLLAIEDTDPTQKDMKQQKNTFEYDVCGNMIHEYMRGNGTGETTTDVTYTYDELHRVTSAHELYGNTWREYQYDSLSNLTYESNSNNVHYDYKLNNLNQLVQKSYSSNDKEGTLYTYDKRGNLVLEEYGKLNGNPNGQKRQTVAEYTYDETNKMVKGVNSIGESSSYLFNGRNALVEQTWHIAKNGYGYHDVDAGIEEPADTTNGKGGNGSGGKGHGNGNGQGNGNGSGDKPTGTTVGDFSTVVKQFVIDYTVETMDPLMEHEVNGLDYRYVYGNERLSVNVSPIPTGAGHIVESGTVGQQIRLYYHQDLRGTVDYLTSPVSQKVESWTHYNEWGEITHNAVLKTGYRELDLVKNYTGHDFDAVLNMYYAKARMYDAENRRFVSIDPILDGTKYDLKDYTTEAVSFSAYVYVKDNPLIYVDPLGLWSVKKTIGGVSIEGEIFYGKVYADIPTLLSAYGITLEESAWSNEEERWLPVQTRSTESATVKYDRNTTNLQLDITNEATGVTKTAFATIVGDGIDLTTHYVDVDYFCELMCDLGYKKTIVTSYDAEAWTIMQGKITKDDEKFKTEKPVIWQALQDLNDTWAEIYKRTVEGYDTAGMEDDIYELMNIVREVGSKKKASGNPIYDAFAKKANLSAVEKVLLYKEPGNVANIVYAGLAARQATKAVYGSGYPVGDNADAYRHSQWSFAAAPAGREITRLFTNAHEYMTFTNFLPANSAANPFLETQMDLFNNAQGIEAWFNKNSWGMSIESPIDLVNNGKTVRLDEGRTKLIPTDATGKK